MYAMKDRILIDIYFLFSSVNTPEYIRCIILCIHFTSVHTICSFDAHKC